jgi:tetratricopeptide (TPR) repeat protein
MLIHQLVDLHEVDASQACALKSAAAAGRTAEARALADAIAKRFPAFVFGETNVANFYLAAGDFGDALQWFQRAYDRGEYDLFAISYLPTTPRNFLTTPGWIALKRKPEGVAWQAAHDRVAADLAAN